MIRLLLLLFNAILFYNASAQLQSRFEKSNGLETATYFEAIDWYQQLAKISHKIIVKEMGSTDADYPLHLVLVSNNGKFNPDKWHAQQKVVILINNGIHPGEPDGIDASMLLVRDIAAGKFILPDNVVLAIIPVYNIGGSLNRTAFSRVNQNGPLQYGFRGNAQNLDLNRDFTKCDSREARSFATIFHLLDPDILVDTHVSDGADYQHTITLLTTQYDKLGPVLGNWLKHQFEPQLYKIMATKGWAMTPYVNFETASPDNGMEMFYDPPRYSSGYAALFQTIAFMPETHMLKPFKDRVEATFTLLKTMVITAGENATELITQRNRAKAAVKAQAKFPLSFTVDSSKYTLIPFMGYEQAFTTSAATGFKTRYYDHQQPFTKNVKLFDVFTAGNIVTKPTAYLIPQGWHAVIELLRLNGVQMSTLKKDTAIMVEDYHIDNYLSYPKAYEKHHKNYQVATTTSTQFIHFLKGDVYIPLNQRANRYLIEMLEPTGEDSFFSWNFFDAILQQKEGYSDYRWESVAATVLKNNPVLQQQLLNKKADTAFAASASRQLDFIYKHSPYYEPAHLRYPVFRIIS